MNIVYLREKFKNLSDKSFESLFQSYLASQLKPMQEYVHYMKNVQAISLDNFNSAMDQIRKELSMGIFAFDDRAKIFNFKHVPV